jgi:hypothetical protein
MLIRKSAANNDLSEILANGNTTGGTDLAVSAGDDITFTATSNAIFADNGKAIFGAGSDLQIYHDGTTSKIDGNLSVTNALTLFAGTANGVTYLNGSKVLTSGSALTFDGTNLGVGANITASASSAPSFTVGTGSGSPAITLYSATNLQSQISFADATTGSGAYDGYLLYDQAVQNMAFGTAATERMRLTSTGLGIGTTSPSNTLEVKSSTNDNGIRLSNSVGSYYHLVRSNGDGLLFDADAGNTGGSGAGNVGIGTTSPAVVSGFVTLDVRGSTNGGFIQASNGTQTVSMYNSSGTSFVGPQTNNALGFVTSGAERCPHRQQQATWVLGRVLLLTHPLLVGR